MMRILIADDERIICEWMKFCITQRPDCELVGVANNGKEALELYQETQPDLVLTDIKMPVMDGLALLHEIRKISSETQVVMLTAFSDFTLAREALRDGANEYLLKTEMHNQSMQELLQRMCAKCKTEAEPAADKGYTAQSYAIIRNIMRQDVDLTDEDLEKLHRCGVKWRNDGLFAIAMWKRQIMMGELRFPIDDSARHIAGFDYTERIYVVVGNLPRILSENEKRHKLTEYAQELQKLNHCMVGVSRIADHLHTIPHTIREAAYTLARGFYTGEMKLYEPMATLEELDLHMAQWAEEFRGLRNQIHKLEPDERIARIKQILFKTNEHNAPDVDLLTSIVCDMMDALYFYANEAGGQPELPDKEKQVLRQSITKEETCGILLHYAEQSFVPPTFKGKTKNKAVSLAIEYLHKNYGKSLSLEQVAEEVYLNPDYFSRVFKEETGTSFITFLTELRLTQSVQLLKSTALRVQDVAQRVGYGNVSYFSTTFKKKYGISPFEYRRRSE